MKSAVAMKIKRIIPYFITAVLLVAYTAFLTVVSLSSGIIGTKRIGFTNGSFAYDTESISVVLLSGETSLLDQFENLKSADFSGSENYEEIAAWAANNPDVDVYYTIKFPNGAVIGCDSKDADLSGIDDSNISAALALLKYTPDVDALNFGDIAVSYESFELVKSTLPDAEINYTIPLLGKSLSKDTADVDLTGLTSADVSSCLNKLKFFDGISTITIGNNATANGEITWQDISDIAAANPEATLKYEFTVAGKSVSLSDESMDLSDISASDVDEIVSVLPGMTQLKSVTLGNIGAEDVQKLASVTNAAFDYPLTLCGKEVNLSDEIWDFNHITVTDRGEEILTWAKCAGNLKILDMDSCGVSNSDMAAIRDELPDVEVIWRVNFGTNYSVRTNVTKILASKPSKGGTLYNADVNEALKYCTKVRYLDLGHNDDLSDFSFVANMPDLEIAVISMCSISDLTPFASCPNLLYLEAGNTNISDLSPLANCKNLKHLNVGTCFGVKDISCLYDLDMLRLWLGSGDPVPSEQVAKMKELHPNCEVNTTASTGLERDDQGNITSEGYTADGWKYYQKYLTSDWAFYSANNNVFPAQRPLGYFKVAYKAFKYNLSDAAYSFSWNDPKYEEHDSSVQAVNTYIIDTSFLSEVWDVDAAEASIVEDVLSDPPGETIQEASY